MKFLTFAFYDRLIKKRHPELVPESSQWSLVAEGAVDWPEQLNALKEDGYLGYLVVETHLRERPIGREIIEGLNAQESNSFDNIRFVREKLR